MPSFEPHAWWRLGPAALERAFLEERAASMAALLQALVRVLECSVVRQVGPPPLVALLADSQTSSSKSSPRSIDIASAELTARGQMAPPSDLTPSRALSFAPEDGQSFLRSSLLSSLLWCRLLSTILQLILDVVATLFSTLSCWAKERGRLRPPALFLNTLVPNSAEAIKEQVAQQVVHTCIRM